MADDIVTSAPETVTQAPTEASGAAPMSRAEAKAAALGQSAQAVPTQAGTESAEPTDPWEAKVKAIQGQVKPYNVRERIAAKQEREKVAQQTSSLQSQFDQVRSQLEQVTTSEQAANAKFEELLKDGKVNEALKVRGLSVALEDLQRAELRARGALSDTPRDPRVDALENKLKGYEEAEAKRQEAIAKHRQQQEEHREWQDGLKAVETELSVSTLPGAASMVKLPGFNDAVLTIMMKNPEADLETAAAVVHRDYRAWFNQLKEAFEGGQQQASPAQRPTQTIAQRVARKPAAPQPLQSSTKGVPLAELKARSKELALKGLT